jgi:hypothetical protein
MDDVSYSPLQWIWQVGTGLFVVILLYHFVARHADFSIKLRNGRVTCKGKIALAQQGEIADFLLRDLAIAGPFTILGCRDKGRLHLWFRGKISAGAKQRIRNFFATA